MKGKGSAKRGYKGGYGFQNKGKREYKGGQAAYIGNKYAPQPVPVQPQVQSQYPQLMATAAQWDGRYVAHLCTLQVQNRFEALSEEDFPEIADV